MIIQSEHEFSRTQCETDIFIICCGALFSKIFFVYLYKRISKILLLQLGIQRVDVGEAIKLRHSCDSGPSSCRASEFQNFGFRLESNNNQIIAQFTCIRRSYECVELIQFCFVGTASKAAAMGMAN